MGYVAARFPPKSTVYDYFVQWRDDGTWAKMVEALRERTRVAAGREPRASAACIDSQSVKTTERGGPERGYDGGKKINGRKRHLLVDTLGLLLAVLITSAGLDDGVAAPLLLGHVYPSHFPRLVTIFADQKDHNHALDTWMAVHRTGWRIQYLFTASCSDFAIAESQHPHESPRSGSPTRRSTRLLQPSGSLRGTGPRADRISKPGASRGAGHLHQQSLSPAAPARPPWRWR